MARIRTIKPQFFTSEDVTAQTPLARLLFVGLFTECDRDGRVEDRPRTLKMRLLPEDECDIDALLWSLVDGGLIRRYEANGVNVIQVSGFEKHQRPHPKEPVSLLPNDGTDRKPCKETASREMVAMLPVDNPSSPVGREGKEYGDSLREGKGTEPLPSRPIISGHSTPKNWGKVHGDHTPGFCDWVCLPDFIFDGFRTKSPGAEYVRNWALNVRSEWEGKTIGDELKFWRERWAESHPTEVAAKPQHKPFSIQEVLDKQAAKKAERAS